MDEASPELSGIAFHEYGNDNAPEDGILYASEVYNLNLNAELVVLSSCESGAGKVVKGEGVMALTRGFLYAGTPNILVSLWKVSDQHTQELMVAFYENLLKGDDYPAALRKAKLAMLADKANHYPDLWSSFILIGR